MRPQEAFDTVWNGMIAQGKPSINGQGCCMYRGPDGAKCAAGMLIPDEEYSSAFEGKLAMYVPYVQENLPIELVLDMQKAHDSAALRMPAFMAYFQKYMRAVAVKHGLTVPKQE